MKEREKVVVGKRRSWMAGILAAMILISGVTMTGCTELDPQETESDLQGEKGDKGDPGELGHMDEIQECAFYDCTNLKNITIGSVVGVREDAFTDTAHYNDETNWTDGMLYIGSALIRCKKDKNGSVTIREGTTCIAGGAFSDCTGLTGITFNGTIEQWNAISKGREWNVNTGSYIVHCTDGDLSKSQA